MWTLQLIGRDCRELEVRMPAVLASLQETFQTYPRTSSIFKHLIAVWKGWQKVAPFLHRTQVESLQEIDKGREKARVFINTFSQ